MKKIFFITVLFLGTLFLTNSVKAEVHPETPPTIGVASNDTDFYSHWQPESFGALRHNDKGVVMALTSGFGLRAGFKTAFDATDFEMQLDINHLDPGVVLTTFFGGQGSYISGNGSYLSIEFLRHTTQENKVLIAIQSTSGGVHNVSMPEFIPEGQEDWEDSAWQGYIIESEDLVIDVKILEEGENVTVTIDGKDFIVSSSKFYEDFVDKNNSYFLIGAFNKDGTIQTVTANYVLDGNKRQYYNEEGTFYTFKNNLEDLEETLLLDLTDSDIVLEGLGYLNALDFDSLFDHDKNFFNDRFLAASKTLNDAVAELGGQIILDDLQTKVQTLESRVALIVDYQTTSQALDRLQIVNDTIDSIDSSEFTEDQLDSLADLTNRRDLAAQAIDDKVFDLVEAQVKALEDAVLDLTTIQNVNAALVARTEVSSDLMELLLEEDIADFETRVNSAIEEIDENTSKLENWTVTEDSFVISNEDTISATFINNRQLISFSEEKIDVRNFTMTLDVISLTTVTGGWLSFGIMENPELFINAEDSSVQGNKGLFFLIINEGQGKARVETYLMTLYANRFFDAQRTGVFTIDITKSVDVEITTEMVTTQGVTDEYMSIVIGGHKFSTDTINLRSMRTALEDYQGYLNIAGSGATSGSPISVVVKDINGKNPNSESLAVEYQPAPYLPESEKTFNLGDTSNLSFEFFNRGFDFTLKVNNEVVAETNYTYTNNVVTLKNDYLSNLEAGEYALLLETANGSQTLQLTVTTDSNGGTPGENDNEGSNVGLIIGLSLGALAIAGGAAFLIIKKKRA